MATGSQDKSNQQDGRPRTRFSSRQPTAQPATEATVAPGENELTNEPVSKAYHMNDFFDTLAKSPEALAAHMARMPPKLGNFLYTKDYAATCEAKFHEFLTDTERKEVLKKQLPSNTNSGFGLSVSAMAPVIQFLVEGHPKAAHRLHRGESGGLTSHLVNRLLSKFDHDGNGVIDSSEFLHMNRFFYTLANFEHDDDFPKDSTGAAGSATLGATDVTAQARNEVDPVSVEAEANKATNGLLAQRLAALWHLLPKTLDGTASADACWNSISEDYELKVLLDQPSTSTCGLATLKSLKEIGALKTNSVGRVTEEEFHAIFSSTKLEAAAEAIVLAERKRRKKKAKKPTLSTSAPSPRVAPASRVNPFPIAVSTAAEGSEGALSAGVATARLLPLLESIWADLPKKPLPGTTKGSSVLVVEAASAWALVRSDSMVVSLMGDGNRSKGLALLRTMRNSNTGSLLCSDGSRVMTQAHFLRLGCRHVLHSAEVEVVLPALLAKLWDHLVRDQPCKSTRKSNNDDNSRSSSQIKENGSTVIPLAVCWTALQVNQPIALLLGDGDLVRGRSLVQALLTTVEPAGTMGAGGDLEGGDEDKNGLSQSGTKMMTWASLLTTMTSPVGMAAARLLVSLPLRLQAIWAELLLLKVRPKKPAAAAWARLENDDELCWLLGSGDSAQGFNLLKLLKYSEEMAWAIDEEHQVSWLEFSQLTNPRVLARAGSSTFLSANVSRLWQKLVQSQSTTSASPDANNGVNGNNNSNEKPGSNPRVPLQACWSAILDDSELAASLVNCDRSLGRNVLLEMRTARALDPPKSKTEISISNEELGAGTVSWAEFRRLVDSKELSQAKLSVLLEPTLQRLWVKLLGTDSFGVEDILATYDDLIEDVDISAAREALAAAGGAVNRASCWKALQIDVDLLRLLGMGQGIKHCKSVLSALTKQVALAKAKIEERSGEKSSPEQEYILWGEFASFANPGLVAAALAATPGMTSNVKEEDLDGQSKNDKSMKSLVQFIIPGFKTRSSDEKKPASENQDPSLDSPEKTTTSSAFESMLSGASSTEPDTKEFLEAAVHDSKVDAIVVEARKSNKANRTRLKHALALRQYVPLQNTSDLRRAAIANDKCIVFTSPDGKFACSARKNQQKYHPGLRCMAVASEDPAIDKLLRYLDSQFVERHPRLKPLGAAHSDVLALPRGAAPLISPFRRGGAKGPQAAAASTARASSLIMDTLKALLPHVNSMHTDATTTAVTALLNALEVMVQADNRKMMLSELKAHKFDFRFIQISADDVGNSHASRASDRAELLGFGKNSAFSLREAASAPSPKSIADDLYARNSGASTRSEQPMTEEHVSGALSRMLGASQQPADSISSTQTTKKLTSDSLTRMLGENQSPLSGASATSSSKQSTNTSTSGALSRMLRGSQNPLNDGNGSPNSSKGGSSRASSSSRSGRSVSGQASNQSNNNRSGVSLDRPPNNHHHHRSHTSASADRAFQNDSSRNRSGGCGGANASPTSTIAGRLSIALGSKEGNNNTTVGPATTRKVVYKVARQDGRVSALENRVNTLEKNAGRSGAGVAYPRKRLVNALGTDDFTAAPFQTNARTSTCSVGQQEGDSEPGTQEQDSPRVSSKFGPRKAPMSSSSPSGRPSPPLPTTGNKEWKGHAPSTQAQASPRKSSRFGPPRNSTSSARPQPSRIQVYQ